MKRLMRSKSGRLIYAPKWQSMEAAASNEIQSDSEPVAASTETVIELGLPTMGKTSRLESLCPSDRQSAMSKAALEGDWASAELLLEEDPSLACDEITEWGDRALHLAVAVNNSVLVHKLVERMRPDDLGLLDGRGYSACCYAAITGMVEIADVMTKKVPNLGTARDKSGITPLHKAALHGNKDMVMYFLKSVKLEDLSNDEWFHLLVVTINSEIYDVASKILEMNVSVATLMTDKEGTALHVLAQHRISGNLDALKLAKNIWEEIQQLNRARVVELMKDPPILVVAAKVGNVELITMLTQTCPSLIWDTDSNGYTMFHIAVKHRQEHVFKLIHQIGAIKDLIAISQDDNGDNILHLAGKLASPDRLETVYPSALQMRREIIWFMEVRKIVPQSCKEMRNQSGRTPRELFYEEHKKLMASSEIWMRNTADSCMLIATIMLTVVFAAAFTVPGGNNQDSGIPLLLKRRWFTCFVIFEAMAFLGSTYSMLMFWTIMTWSTRDFYEDNFLHDLLYILKWGLAGLLGSLVSTIAAFMSAYFLAFVEEKTALVESVIILVFIIFLYAIYNQFSAFFYSMTFVEYVFLFRKHDLFSRVENRVAQV